MNARAIIATLAAIVALVAWIALVRLHWPYAAIAAFPAGLLADQAWQEWRP